MPDRPLTTAEADRLALRTPSTVIFDIGGVLIDWNPRHLFCKLIPDAAEMEHFLATVCTPDWNHRQDEGRTWGEAVAELSTRFPQYAPLIEAYDRRWEEMVPGVYPETVAILEELHARGTPLYALSNFSTEKFVIMRRRYAFLQLFRDIVVSGEIGFAKPDPRIYRYLLERHDLRAGDCLFIDDVMANVAAARSAGLQAIHFTRAATLHAQFTGFGLL
jgi:2-haloacid dehalogenase